MRHLRSLATAVLVVPSVWLAAGFGQRWSTGAVAAWAGVARPDTAALLVPAALLAAAGLGVAVLALPRVSPLGALAAGGALVAPTAALLTAPQAADRVLDGVVVAGRTLPLTGPVHNGTLLLLGAALLVTAAAPGRWRTPPAPAPEPPPLGARLAAALREEPPAPLPAPHRAAGAAGAPPMLPDRRAPSALTNALRAAGARRRTTERPAPPPADDLRPAVADQGRRGRDEGARARAADATPAGSADAAPPPRPRRHAAVD